MTDRAIRMLLATMALAAFAALVAGTANARPAGGADDPSHAYPSHVIGAGASQWDGRTLPGAVAVSGAEVTEVPRRRVTNGPYAGGAAETPRVISTSTSTEGNGAEWTSFAAGAGAAALLAAAVAGLVLVARRRHAVGLP
jgi:hypothetical protein